MNLMYIIGIVIKNCDLMVYAAELFCKDQYKNKNKNFQIFL